MNHKHRKTLHALFAHPVSANISPPAVDAVFGELGGAIEHRHGCRIGVRLNGHFAEFAHPQHSMSPDQVRQAKKFVEEAGIDPEKDYPLHGTAE